MDEFTRSVMMVDLSVVLFEIDVADSQLLDLSSRVPVCFVTYTHVAVVHV